MCQHYSGDEIHLSLTLISGKPTNFSKQAAGIVVFVIYNFFHHFQLNHRIYARAHSLSLKSSMISLRRQVVLLSKYSLSPDRKRCLSASHIFGPVISKKIWGKLTFPSEFCNPTICSAEVFSVKNGSTCPSYCKSVG